MTFASGSKMFYSISGVSFDDLCTILRGRANILTSSPTIHFDCSWLARKLNTTTSSPVPAILAIARQFCKADIKVVLVLDNRHYRHHSKKASLVRDRKAEQSRVDAIVLKQKLMLKIRQQKDGSLPPEILDQLNNKIEDIDNKIKKKVKNVLDRLQYKTFYDDIYDAV